MSVDRPPKPKKPEPRLWESPEDEIPPLRHGRLPSPARLRTARLGAIVIGTVAAAAGYAVGTWQDPVQALGMTAALGLFGALSGFFAGSPVALLVSSLAVGAGPIILIGGGPWGPNNVGGLLLICPLIGSLLTEALRVVRSGWSPPSS